MFTSSWIQNLLQGPVFFQQTKIIVVEATLLVSTVFRQCSPSIGIQTLRWLIDPTVQNSVGGKTVEWNLCSLGSVCWKDGALLAMWGDYCCCCCCSSLKKKKKKKKRVFPLKSPEARGIQTFTVLSRTLAAVARSPCPRSPWGPGSPGLPSAPAGLSASRRRTAEGTRCGRGPPGPAATEREAQWRH